MRVRGVGGSKEGSNVRGLPFPLHSSVMNPRSVLASCKVVFSEQQQKKKKLRPFFSLQATCALTLSSFLSFIPCFLNGEFIAVFGLTTFWYCLACRRVTQKWHFFGYYFFPFFSLKTLFMCFFSSPCFFLSLFYLLCFWCSMRWKELDERERERRGSILTLHSNKRLSHRD